MSLLGLQMAHGRLYEAKYYSFFLSVQSGSMLEGAQLMIFIELINITFCTNLEVDLTCAFRTVGYQMWSTHRVVK